MICQKLGWNQESHRCKSSKTKFNIKINIEYVWRSISSTYWVDIENVSRSISSMYRDQYWVCIEFTSSMHRDQYWVCIEINIKYILSWHSVGMPKTSKSHQCKFSKTKFNIEINIEYISSWHRVCIKLTSSMYRDQYRACIKINIEYVLRSISILISNFRWLSWFCPGFWHINPYYYFLSF